MKKKLYILVIAILLLCFSITGLSFMVKNRSTQPMLDKTTDTPKPSFNIVSADRLRIAEDTIDLGNFSDLIVVASVLPDKENKLIERNGLVVHGYTKTNLQVISVLGGQLSPNADIISITEEYFYVPNEDGTTDYWTQEAYLPANENETYLFFLKKYDDSRPFAGMYYPIDLQYGKYVLNPPINLMSDSALDSLEVLDNAYAHDYPTWYSEIYNTYISEYLGEQTDAVPDTDPSTIPDADPSAIPDADPSAIPDADPSAIPDTDPSTIPDADPSAIPDTDPSTIPDADPSTIPDADTEAPVSSM